MSSLMTSWLRTVNRLLANLQESRKTKLGIVFLALLLDNLLLTVVVPIIPDYLLVLEAADELDDHLLSNGTFNNNTNSRPWFLNNTSQFGQINETTLNFQLDQDSYLNENSRVGWLLSSKAFVQLVTNPFVGPLTNRYGYSITMFAGFVVLMSSTMLFAFGESYSVLFLARAVQGVASSCTAIAGMTMLAHAYPDDKERSKAMGIALGGMALGVLIGYPFGGVMYQFVGKMAPFVIIAALVFVEGVLQLWALEPSKPVEHAATGTPVITLLRDPYIIVAAGTLMIPEIAMAMLEPTVPMWLLKNMHPEKWQLGIVFVPDSIGFWLGCNLFGTIALRFGRWRISVVGLVMMAISMACIPFATHIYHLIVPHFGVGLALGMVDAAVMPLLALLVDRRHVAVYGNVYAIGQVAISLGFAIGPSLGGVGVKLIGFAWLMRAIAIVNVVYSPFCYFLKDPPTKEENKSILKENGQSQYTEQDQSFSYRQLQED